MSDLKSWFNQKNFTRLVVAVWPACFLAVVTFATFFTTLVVKDHTFYVFQDNIDQFYAWYQKLAQSVHSGTLPIWDSNVSSGHSFVGELQAGVFYPVNLLWVKLFGSIHGISVFWLELLVVFHFWLAGLGMYLAARSIGLAKASSLAAGMVYAFSGGVAVRSVAQTAIFFGLAYIPWAFFWFQRWLKTNNKRNLFWCSFFLAMIILAGHLDPWYFACLIIAFAIIFRPLHPSFRPWLKTSIRQLAILIVAALCSLIIALPQVLLSAQYLPHAVRFVGDPQPITTSQKVSLKTFTTTYTYKPEDTLSLFNPVQYPVADGNETYVGLVGLAVIVFCVLLLRQSLVSNIVWKSKKVFIIGASAVATIIMIGYWTFIPALMRELPLFSQVRQLARYSIIVQFCLSLLLGICIEVIAENYTQLFRNRRQKIIGLTSGLVVTAFIAMNSVYLWLVSRRSSHIDKHFVYQNIVLVITLAACLLFRKRILYVLLAGIALSTLTNPVWFQPKIADFQSTYPPNYYQSTSSIKYLQKYYGQYRVKIMDKALPVNIGDVYKIQTTDGYGATLHQNYYDFLNEPDPAGQPGLNMDLLNTRFIVSKSTQPDLKKVFTDSSRGVTIYERPTYLPRAYFADQLTACRNHTPGCTPIELSSYSDSDIKLHYEINKMDTLVLSEITYTGWKAYIDNQPTQMSSYSPTSVKLFRAVKVPAGSHSVEFRYQPFGL